MVLQALITGKASPPNKKSTVKEKSPSIKKRSKPADYKCSKSTPARLNCWEFKNCGREPGGVNAEKDGVCAAALEGRLDGFHGGTNAGRACWAVAGTYCQTQKEGTFAQMLTDCMNCDFHQLVVREEETYSSPSKELKQIKKEEKRALHEKSSFLEHIRAKSRVAAEENEDIESLFISILIGFTSFCPSISMLQGSKRLCKDDLVDELWAIDSISDQPKKTAARLFTRTIAKAVGVQIRNYFRPLFPEKSS